MVTIHLIYNRKDMIQVKINHNQKCISKTKNVLKKNNIHTQIHISNIAYK